MISLTNKMFANSALASNTGRVLCISMNGQMAVVESALTGSYLCVVLQDPWSTDIPTVPCTVSL